MFQQIHMYVTFTTKNICTCQPIKRIQKSMVLLKCCQINRSDVLCRGLLKLLKFYRQWRNCLLGWVKGQLLPNQKLNLATLKSPYYRVLGTLLSNNTSQLVVSNIKN